MKIESEIGAGTSISLYLPRSTSATAANPTRIRRQVDDSRGTILVVEDDLTSWRSQPPAVRSFGYDVHFAPDAQAALAMLQRGTPIDVCSPTSSCPRDERGRIGRGKRAG